MNRLLKKRERMTMLSMRCRNITPEMLTAMQEQKENEEKVLEASRLANQRQTELQIAEMGSSMIAQNPLGS